MTTRTSDSDVFEVARLTPIGRGAVACVGVRGKTGWSAFLERWRRADGRETPADFETWSPNAATRPFFGLFRLNELGDASEEIVLRRRTATAFELNGHGGDVVSSAVVRFFVERGASEISGDRWERVVESEELGRADSRLDALFFAAADALTVETATETTAKIALAQRIAWRNWFAEVAFELNESNGAHRPSARRAERLAKLANKIDRIAKRFELGSRLTAPFVVLLTGIPNVGKSSLLNAILGFRRVVVSPTSGTTRDLVDAPKIVDGWLFRFVDAAGLRDANDPIERAGTRLAVDAASQADVVLRLFDATLGKAEQEAVFDRFFVGKFAKSGAKIVDVLNKIDLPRDRWRDDWNEDGAAGIFPISATAELGVDALLRAIFDATVGDATVGDAAATAALEPLPWRADQLDFLNELRGFVERGDVESALTLIDRAK